MNYYKLSFKSLTDGRSFTQEITTPVSLNAEVVKAFYESKCNVELISFSECTYFESTFSENSKNLTFTGYVTLQGLEIPVHRKIMPLYKNDFDVLSDSDLKQLQTDLQIIYGSSFELKTVRFD